MSLFLTQFHNIAQVVMWLAVLVWMPFLDWDKAYDNTHWRILLNVAQTAQFHDIIFSYNKWVKNNIVQVAARYFIMLIIIYVIFPQCGACYWISAVVVALCLTEITRYGFYTGYCKSLAGALRYNLFIVIMPVNQFTEFMTCYRAFQNTDLTKFAVVMPNAWNVAFYPRWLFLVLPMISISTFTP